MRRLLFVLLVVTTLFHCSACAFADRSLGVPVPIPDAEPAPTEKVAAAAPAAPQPAPATSPAAPMSDSGTFIISDEEPCDDCCCDPCKRCFLGALIAKFDATYENALACRRYKRPLCNQSRYPSTWCAPCDSPCGSNCNSFAGYGRSAQTVAVNSPPLPARFASPPARSAPPQATVAERTASRPAVATKPVSTPLASEPQEAQAELSAPVPSESQPDEPVKLNSPKCEAGATLMPMAPTRAATARVERAEFSTAGDTSLASTIAVAADDHGPSARVSFSEAAPTASAVAASAVVRTLDTRPAVEVRFKCGLDEQRLSDVNPLR